MARRKLKEAQEKLLRQASGDFGDGSSARGKYQAEAPEASMYGVFQPAYAQSLSQSTGAAGADILNQMALRNNAQAEREAYARALIRANEVQQQLQANDAYYGFMSDAASRNPDYLDRGVMGIEQVEIGEDGRPRVVTDPALAYKGNAEATNAMQAERMKELAEGYGILRTHGYEVPNETVSRSITSPWDTTATPVRSGMAPREAIEDFRVRNRLDEGLTADQQFEMERIRAEARNKGIQGKWVYDPQTQRYQFQISGDIEEMTGAGYGIPRGAPPLPSNPNADAQGGGASATPAANAKAVAEQLFPGIVITDWKRDPNSALGRKNPKSWHNRSGGAIDAKPIKGMSFEQYVQRYREAGYPIIDARDEVRNPSKHATGPHWHVVIGEKQTQADSTVRPRGGANTNAKVLVARAKARGLEATANEDGSVTVQTPNGPITYGPDGKRKS